jgi:hypothetical protein
MKGPIYSKVLFNEEFQGSDPRVSDSAAAILLLWRAASAAVLSLLAQLSLAPACARASIVAPRHAPGMADKEPELAAAAGRVSDGAPTAADDAAKVAEELELVAVVSECMGKIIMDIIKKAGTAGADEVPPATHVAQAPQMVSVCPVHPPLP